MRQGSNSRPGVPATTQQHQRPVEPRRPAQGDPLAGRFPSTRRQASPRALRITALGYRHLLGLQIGAAYDCAVKMYVAAKRAEKKKRRAK